MKDDVFGEILDTAVDNIGENERSLFYHFETWDGPDGLPPKHTPGGSKFQTSKMLSTTQIRPSIAGTQSGKTISDAVETIIMMTGEIPYSLRYDEGYDTKIKRILPSQDRELGVMNIRRWGRINKETGKLIDHDESAKEDGTWDCGTIIGVGKYPKEKISTRKNDQAWICSYQEGRNTRWIPLLKQLIPPQCLNKNKGDNGFMSGDHEFHLEDGNRIILLTYEQGYKRVESYKSWVIVLDEEPMDRRFYSSGLGHMHWMLICYTPINGMTWAYDDIYLPALERRNPSIELFSATAYDCPYKTKAELKMMEETLNAYEIDSKLYGKYSKREGVPYFPYDIVKKYIRDYSAEYRLAKIEPVDGGMINKREIDSTKMHMVYTDIRDASTWEIYEDVQAEYAYYLSADTAKGLQIDENKENLQDMSIQYIFKVPSEKDIQEFNKENPTATPYPKIVAALYSSEPPENAAMLGVYGAVYYNRCLVAPETRGEHGGSYLTEIRDYPFIYQMTVINDRTRKPTNHIGFDTNARTRTPAINKVRKYINDNPEHSGIGHMQLIKEMLDMVWLKGRPDHPEGGKSDCVMGFAIGLWVWEEGRHQIQNNRLKENKDVNSFLSFLRRKENVRPLLGQRTIHGTKKRR